jgi:hypothetical protein
MAPKAKRIKRFTRAGSSQDETGLLLKLDKRAGFLACNVCLVLKKNFLNCTYNCNMYQCAAESFHLPHI